MKNRIVEYLTNGNEHQSNSSQEGCAAGTALDADTWESAATTVLQQSRNLIRKQPLAIVVGGLIVGLTIGWLVKRQ